MALDSSASLPEVSWQTLFWITTTLALNSMTQPCGQVCRTPSRYRTYLRSSPLICVLDIINLWSKWIYLAYSRRLSLSHSAKLVITERFGANAPAPAEGGNEKSESSTWLRWLLFVMGPLPQAVRLTSFENVALNQALGAAFLVPWLICEVLIYCSKRMDMDRARTIRDEDCVPIDQNPVVMLCGAMSVGMLFLEYASLFYSRVREWNMLLTIAACYIAGPVHIPPVYMLLVGLRRLFTKFPAVGKSILGRSSIGDTEGSRWALEDTAVLLFMVFLLNLSLCILGYLYLYEPSGTVNPGWTSAFG